MKDQPALPLSSSNATADRPQHLIGLATSNYMQVRVVRAQFSPDGGLIPIAGQNGAGKSSLIASVKHALAGEIPDKPLRIGATEGEVIAETEDYTVRVGLTETGEYLTLRAKTGDGKPLRKPRELLDAMFSQFVDPQEFAERMDNAKRCAFLLKVSPVALDLPQNATAIAAAFADRTVKNREVTKLEAQRAAFKTVPTERPEPVDATVLMTERHRRETVNRKRSSLIDSERKAWNELQRATAQVADAQRVLREAERMQTKAIETHIAAQKLVEAAPVECLFNDIDDKLASAAHIATDIAAFDQYETVSKDLQKAKTEAQVLTDRIESLRTARADALKKAEFPVEGLGIDLEGNVTFNGVPFSQESQAKRLRIAVALLVAANPKMRFCFIAHGALLDQTSQAALAELCKTYGLQCFIEVLDSKEPATVRLVDGEVAK